MSAAERGWTHRLQRLLPAVWLGGLLAIAFIAAPALFAQLDRAVAGRVAARLFAVEAPLSLVLGLLLAALERRHVRDRLEAGLAGSQFTLAFALPMAALFCTVLGYYGLQPMMAAARGGEGPWSFGALHAASSALYGIKALCVAALAWRCAAR